MYIYIFLFFITVRMRNVISMEYGVGSRQVGKNILAFYSKHSPLSNFYMSDFTVDNLKYNCLEQYLMREKAMLFNDHTMAGRIMTTDSPFYQQAFGRNVKTFNLKKWRLKAPKFLLRGILAKFSQVPHCSSYLRMTGGMILVEANSKDDYFGIGVGLHASEAQLVRQSEWGYNLLGRTLMSVRSRLFF